MTSIEEEAALAMATRRAADGQQLRECRRQRRTFAQQRIPSRALGRRGTTTPQRAAGASCRLFRPVNIIAWHRTPLGDGRPSPTMSPSIAGVTAGQRAADSPASWRRSRYRQKAERRGASARHPLSISRHTRWVRKHCYEQWRHPCLWRLKARMVRDETSMRTYVNSCRVIIAQQQWHLHHRSYA